MALDEAAALWVAGPEQISAATVAREGFPLGTVRKEWNADTYTYRIWRQVPRVLKAAKPEFGYQPE